MNEPEKENEGNIAGDRNINENNHLLSEGRADVRNRSVERPVEIQISGSRNGSRRRDGANQNTNNLSKSLDSKVTEEKYVANKNSLPYLQELVDTMGLTNFHILICFACCIFYFNDGCLIFELNFIYPELKKVLKLTNVSQAVLTSSLFLGKLFGSSSSGLISSAFGREYPLKILSGCLAIFSLIILLFENFYWMCACRMIVGFALESMSCLFLPTITEYIPSNRREFVLTTVLSFSRIGIIFYVFCFYMFLGTHITLEDRDPTAIWKYSIMLSSLVTVFGFALTNIAVRESPRFLIINKRVDEGIETLQEIAAPGTTIDRLRMHDEAEDYSRNTLNATFMDLFTKYLKVSILMAITIFCASTNYIGNMYALPKTFSNKYETKLLVSVIFQQVLSVIGLIIGAFLAYTKTLGRKYTLFISFFFPMIISILTLIQKSGFEISSPIMNMFITISYVMSKIYVSEVFPTRLRVSALAFVMSAAQIGNFSAPPLCDLLTNYHVYGSLILLGLSSFIGSISTLFLPYETSKKAIDYY